MAASAAEDARFRLAMASAGIGMAIVSTEGHWIEVNPALCKLFGYRASELVGQPAQALSHPDDLPLTHGVLERLLGGDEDQVEVEKRYLRADSSVIEMVVNVALMRDTDGRAEYFISQFRDVTAQRQAERALREINASLESRVQERTLELAAANRRLEAFVHGVSHDLRAPLRTIDGFATQLMRATRDQLDTPAQEHLQRIRAATARMGGLIDGLLELARVNRGKLRPTRVDVSLLAQWALAELQDAQPQREADVDVQPGLEVIGDERLLKTLLDQLLSNAWRFSASRPQVWIRVQGERKGDRLEVSIHDRGIGFDMAYSAKLFEPFQRLHGGDQGAGNGIGLTIAQQVAMRHGGNIHAQAEPGNGACLQVELHDQTISEGDA
jgi:PAS domain S-box-containing protein